jgi:predicted metalloprotease with PDZ domain
LIRQSTNGKRSLDDFCKSFYGGSKTQPEVKTYTAKDVFTALNEIVPYDWEAFFQKRVYEIAPRAPLNGIQNSGWDLVYKDVRTAFQVDIEEALEDAETVDLSESIGLKLKEDGSIIDVIQGSPAAQSGIGPGMKLIAVNQRRYSDDVIRAALKSAKAEGKNLELLVENTEIFKTYNVNYQQGERYPHLERKDSKSDYLQKITQPLTQ